ncbi:MAG TPA: benzoyl-CoA 2,3-epoxidase subunit BoxB [Candidatus Polarisedimenticolia bacterium]|nr:benzoyl-CoA 2,3-epoxidase subunit BoxB [Candidatus Polarisedimenticolia bacterium]
MTSIDLDATIPNNVDLSTDKRLQRALEQWQPSFREWWKGMGPDRFQDRDVYLRTAIAVDSAGWAHFDYVRMPEYRWGIFLAAPEADRKIGFGDNMGQPVWQEVPGEHRNALRRLIVTQGDTEPASVEQQRQLGATAPSLYDLRNLFQVNVEEGRHLWAMVYLLHAYFGRDGREEAEALLARRSGDPDKPRILGAFNAPIEDWLSFFMFTMFTDRDGKFQLLALAESGFDPLSRTTRFMLTEEAHHMFVGETGVRRIVQRAAELTKEAKGGDVRALGGIDLATLQKYVNDWYALSLDLFGGEISSNAADYFANGLKGRANEKKHPDHLALEGVYSMQVPEGSRLVTQEVPMRNALNEVIRDAYIDDNQRAVDQWNKTLADNGVDFRIRLPFRGFNRRIGLYANLNATPDGTLVSREEWERRKDEWLPSESDRAYVASLMQPVYEPGKIANWIAPPTKGINNQPLEFEYVRLKG